MTKELSEILKTLEGSGKLEDLSIEELEIYERYLRIKSINREQGNLKLDQQELWYKNNPDKAPQDKLGVPIGEVKGADDGKYQAFYNSYHKRNETVRSRSQYDNKLNAKDMTFQVYENQRWIEAGFDKLWINTNSDTGCDDDVSDWSPDDVYAKVVWETFVCKADLFRVCVKGIDINPGEGLKTQIRLFGAFGDPTELNACECASCASITWTTYPLTLKQYNLEAIVCDKDIWDVGSVMMDSYIKAMSDSWARWFDAQIYSELETAVAGTDVSLANALSCTPSISGSCCSDTGLVDMYNAISEVIATMREGATPYDPDWIIMSPSVARVFKRMQTPQAPAWFSDIKFGDDGRLKSISGLKVIEYCGANACAATSGQELAIIVDSRRAIGAVFGQRPKLYKFFQSNCNSYRIDQWAYFACGELDLNAIGHVTNP